MRRISALLFAVPFLFLACQDREAVGPERTLGTLDPRFAISDGANAGNPHFYFLPPIVKAPAPTGVFNGALSPAVDICEWNGTACSGPVRTFTKTASADGKNFLKVSLIDEHYHVNWQTKSFAEVGTGDLFRVLVRLGTATLGWVDVGIAGNGKAKNVVTGADVMLVDGQTLPIKFRVEEGAFAAAVGIDPGECTDCTEAAVSNTNPGPAKTTPSGEAGAEFEPGFLDGVTDDNGDPVEEINVLIQKLDSPCLTTDLQQFPGCSRFISLPDVQFSKDVVVGVCLESVSPEARKQVALHKQEEQEVDGEYVPVGPVEELEDAPAPFLTGCAPPEIAGRNNLLHYVSGRAFFAQEDCAASYRDAPRRPLDLLAAAARRVLSPVAMLGLPSAAHACDRGYGGTVGSFSRVSWARPVDVEVVSGDGQTATAGPNTTVDVVVKTTAKHIHAGETEADPAGKVPLRYHFVTPNGAITPTQTAETDVATGLATISWPLASVGTHQLVVTAPGTNLADRNTSGVLVPRAVPQVVASVVAAEPGPVAGSLVGDHDHFGYGTGNFIPCSFYDLSDPVIDLGIFDRELTSGDEVEAWTHDFSTTVGTGFTATGVTVRIAEYFTDFSGSTITIDGTELDFAVNGFSKCNAPIVQTFSFSGTAAAFANDGIIEMTFRENGDDVALDYSHVEVHGTLADGSEVSVSSRSPGFSPIGAFRAIPLKTAIPMASEPANTDPRNVSPKRQ